VALSFLRAAHGLKYLFFSIAWLCIAGSPNIAQAKPSQAKPSQAKPSQAKPSRAVVSGCFAWRLCSGVVAECPQRLMALHRPLLPVRSRRSCGAADGRGWENRLLPHWLRRTVSIGCGDLLGVREAVLISATHHGAHQLPNFREWMGIWEIEPTPAAAKLDSKISLKQEFSE
jgi:hypothetical protein